ncbi:hypothetical protein ABZX12_18580 [Kribbella sp. NPDC003505]|uniref:hypothetical protein n=1 Tax=Kribbella sp. NPDC003505 TaxID=3154448 RepID=UPI0033A9E4D3
MTFHLPNAARHGLPIAKNGLQAIGYRKDGRPIWPVVGADGTQTVEHMPMVQRLLDERQSTLDFVERTVNEANTQKRDLSTSESETLANSRKRIKELDDQLTPLLAFEEDKARAAQLAQTYAPQQTGPTGAGQPAAGLGGDQARTNPRVKEYKTRGEVIVDHIRAAGLSGTNFGQGIPDADARDRLIANGVIPPSPTDDQIRNANKHADQIRSRFETEGRATQVSGDMPGIIPVPIVGAVMSDVDAARPFINSLGAKPLDFAGETFKRPLITQHVAMGKQTTQAATTGLGSQKMIIGSVTFAKETWGGWLDVSRQDLDWTSPSAWDALLNDFSEQYGLVTENAAGDAFAAAVTAGNTPVEVGGTGTASTLNDYAVALYAAAALAYAGAGRMPDRIWMSLDMWGALGPKIESAVPTMGNDLGQVNIGDFQAGNLLKLPRTVVPSFPSGTIIIGSSRWTEVYEERIGLLQAVNPSILGVQIAYGGYVAYNTIKPTAFCKVVNAT